MALQPIPHVVPLAFSAVTAAVLGAYAWLNRDRPGATPLAAILLGVFVWTAAYALQLAFTDLFWKTFWARAEYFGVTLVPAAWVLFALEYTGADERVNYRTAAALSVEPVAFNLLVWTNAAHGLVRGPSRTTTVTILGDAYVAVAAEAQLAFWVHVAYSYLVVVLGAVVVLRTVVLTDDPYQGQGIALLVATLVPLVGSVLSVGVDLVPSLAGLVPHLHLTPFTFLVSGVALSWALFRHRLLRLVPLTREVARDQLVATMDDAILVVDDGGRIADTNPVAVDLVGRPRSELLGRPLSSVAPDLATALSLTPGEEVVEEVDLERGHSRRTYDVRASPLYLSGGVRAGHLISLRDVTDRKQRRQRLDVLNRLLRHNIRNDMNFVEGSADVIGRQTDDEAVAARAEAIAAAAQRLAERSDKLRKATRELDREEGGPVDLVPTVEHEVAGIRRHYPAATVRVSAPDRAVVHAGASVGLVVEELVENAVEHGDAAAPTVEVRVERDDGRVRVHVADDGPGIPENELATLRSGTETPLEHASGIGLWMANWIVQTYGGSLEFAANDPRGTVATVRLPAADESTLDPASAPAETARSRGDDG